jgi:hypothetical protein
MALPDHHLYGLCPVYSSIVCDAGVHGSLPGMDILQTEKPERYVHVPGGASIFIRGAAMVFIGW